MAKPQLKVVIVKTAARLPTLRKCSNIFMRKFTITHFNDTFN